MNKEESDRNSSIEEMLGAAVDVSDAVLRKCEQKGDFSELAFELHKETGIIVALCGDLCEGVDPQNCTLSRNQAICAGLLVRIAKFMLAITHLASSARRGDVVMALNRCISESAINARFLLQKREDRWYEQFARFSLGPERELYDIIQSNIKQRGDKVLPIEQRMLKSIDRVCRLTKVKIADVKKTSGDWGGGLRERLKAIGREEIYSSVRIGSHAVHGTWVDLVLHHLEEKDDEYIPNPSWSDVDARLMLPVCKLVLDAAHDYVTQFFANTEEMQLLVRRLEDLQTRIRTVDDADETWRSGK